MSDRELDKLFRNKLGRMEVAPSEEAWSRLAGRTHKPAIERKFYWGIAASVLVIFTLGIMIGKNVGSETQVNQTITENVSGDEMMIRPEPAQVETNTLDEVQEVADLTVNEEENQNSAIKTAAEPATSARVVQVNMPSSETEMLSNEEQLPDREEREWKELGHTSGMTLAIAEPEKKNVNINGLPKETESKVTEKRGINVNRLFMMAKDLKTDNNSWAALREAKNELLSLGRNDEGSDD